MKDRSSPWSSLVQHSQRTANVQQISTSGCDVFFFFSVLPGWALPARNQFVCLLSNKNILSELHIYFSKQFPPEVRFSETWKTLAYFYPASTAVCTSGSVKVCGTFERNRCLLRAALLRRTSLPLFIHNLSSSSTSIPSSAPPVLHIRAPVSFPVTVALTIRSASGLFKAFGTQCLDLFCDQRAWEGNSVALKGKTLETMSSKWALIWGGISQGAPSVVFWKRSSKVCWMKYSWARVAQPVTSLECTGAMKVSFIWRSLTAPFTHMCSRGGSDH